MRIDFTRIDFVGVDFVGIDLVGRHHGSLTIPTYRGSTVTPKPKVALSHFFNLKTFIEVFCTRIVPYMSGYNMVHSKHPSTKNNCKVKIEHVNVIKFETSM